MTEVNQHQANGVHIWSISKNIEQHCIKCTNDAKQLKADDNQQIPNTEITNRAVNKGVEMSARSVTGAGCDNGCQEFSITEGYKEHKLEIIKGKTSGVTGGAVVEIEKNGESKKYMLKNIFNTEKTYKNIFGKEKRHSGKHFYDPNCKSEIRSFFTRHTLQEVNESVLKEFIALRLANVVSKGIAPDAILGKIAGDGNGEQEPVRYCLLTEMAGQGKDEEFDTLDDIRQRDTTKSYGVDKAKWQSFYAIGIGLLNDKDVAKKDNIGVVKKGYDKDANLSLFDLGHASPDEFELDPKTLLPKSKSKLADFVLWLINLFVPANSISGTFYFDEDIQRILTLEERKDALQDLLYRKNDIMNELDKINNELKETNKDIVCGDNKVVEDMERRIKARFDQLRAVL